VIIRLLLSLVALLIFSTGVVRAQRGAESGGAWVRADNGYHYRIALSSFTASRQFDRSGERRGVFADSVSFQDGSFGATDIELKGELGLNDWLTGTASTAYRVAVRQGRYLPTGRDSTESASGMGDVWLGARIRLMPLESLVATTVTLGWKAPLASYTQEIPLGTGVAEYEIRLAGGSYYRLGDVIEGHAQIAASYRLRNRGSDEIHYLAETGLGLAAPLTLQTILDGIISTADIEKAGLPGAEGDGASPIFDQSFTRLGLSLLYLLDEDTELVAGYSRILAGRNALAGGSLTFGISWFK
jgi:hypothetical protein